MSRGKSSEVRVIRELIENFEADKLELTAFGEMRRGCYKSLSYGELQSKIKIMAQALAKLGLKKGDKVGLLSENRLEWGVCYLATTYMGAVITPLDIFLGSKELEAIVKSAGVKVLFCSKAYLKKVYPFKTHSLKRIICFDRVEKTLKNTSPRLETEGNRYLDFNSLLEVAADTLKEEGESPLPEINGDDTAALIFMEEEIFAELSHNNIISNGYSFIKKVGRPTFKERLIAQLPLHHTYPVLFGLIAPILSYSEVTFIARVKNKAVFEAARKTSPHCMVVVPLSLEHIYLGFYDYLRQDKNLPDSCLSSSVTINQLFHKVAEDENGKKIISRMKKDLGLDSFQLFICGGSPLSGWLVSGMKSLGIEVLQGYGLTEASPVVSCNTSRDNRPGSIGAPLAGVKVKIDNPNELGEGELLVKGPNVMKGYCQAPEKTARKITSGGWLRTGDMAWIDDQGFIYLTGRLKKVIVNKGGKNIYPAAIERRLEESPYFEKTALVSKTDYNGEYPHAVILLDKKAALSLEREQGDKLSQEELRRLAAKELSKISEDMPSYKTPGSFEIAGSKEELLAIKENPFRIQTPPPLSIEDYLTFNCNSNP